MNKLFTLFCIVLMAFQLNAQNGAAINTTGHPSDPSAMLDVSSTSSGALLPRMTTTQRDNILNPAQGLLIINITTNCFEIYFSPVWQPVYCGCNPPAAPAEAIHTPSETGVIWNWNAVSGATGYKYNTVNNYATAADNGSGTSYSQTGLTCNTSYTLYVWAYGDCGASTSPAILTQTTSACFACGSNTVTFSYRGAPVTYGTVTGQNNTCWLDRNLGALQVATAFNDVNAYGDLFQWGRLDDGHQDRYSTSTTTLSSTDVPGHSKYIEGGGNGDWRNPQNNSLWQGVTGANNPCPVGWRLPVESELASEGISWSPQDYNGAFASPLKITAGGSRSGSSIYSAGSTGFYWSSTLPVGIGAQFLYVNLYGEATNGSTRAEGMSVRCIKD